MTLNQFKDELLKICPETYHYEAVKESERYVVWGEAYRNVLSADDVSAEIDNIIAVELYTKTEYDDINKQLLDLFDSNDELSLTDYVVNYDTFTGLIHHSYTVEVI